MQYTSKEDLFLTIEEGDLPSPKYSRALLPLSTGGLGLKGCLRYVTALDALVVASSGHRKGAYLSSYREHMNRILLNLAQCMFSMEWLALPGDKTSYTKGKYWHDTCNMSYRPTRACVDYLKSEELVFFRAGYNNSMKGKSYSAKYFPTPELQKQIFQVYLVSEVRIEPPYVLFNDATGDLEPSQHDIERMTRINVFMKDHNWACKSPFRLIYSGGINRGGRVDCRFSGVPSRKIPLRINTLIDGVPLVEVDYKANHLRMAMYIIGYDAPEDPYSVIDNALPEPIGRDRIKQFMTTSLGSNSSEQAFSALKSYRFTRELFESVKGTALEMFPRLPLFNDIGAHLQSIEGQIAIDIMLAGVESGIPVLPVHDSFAVQRNHEEWLIKTMLSIWPKHVSFEEGASVAYISVKRPS